MSRIPKKSCLCVICGADEPSLFSTSNYSRCIECFNSWRRIQRGKGRGDDERDVMVWEHYDDAGTPLKPLLVSASGKVGGIAELKKEIKEVGGEYLDRYNELLADNKRMTEENEALRHMLTELTGRLTALESEVKELKAKANEEPEVNGDIVKIVKILAKRSGPGRPSEDDKEALREFADS